MSRFPKAALAAAAVLAASFAPAAAQDAALGEKVFARCKACHAVGEDAKNRVGPHLNDLFGRAAGSIGDFKYSPAMSKAGEGDLVWEDQTLAEFLTKPKDFVKGTKMAFAGLKKEDEIANLTAYLKTFSSDAAPAAPTDDASETPVEEKSGAAAEPAEAKVAAATEAAPAEAAAEVSEEAESHGVFHLGRPATEDEIAAWDIDVRPDGAGLPEGRGTVLQGETLFADQCASCHGDFGEAVGRWPVLAGGQGTLMNERPEKTVGSFWPYLSTVYDYIRRAMPFGDARSLSDDEVYALTAYVLYLNDIVTDEDFELSKENFTSIRLPNEDNFIDDDRLSEKHYAANVEPCMKDCKPGKAEITKHAAVLDVTPDSSEGEENTGGID
ncbi:MAG: c-type cytochrome [Pseudaminobacter sp.]